MQTYAQYEFDDSLYLLGDYDHEETRDNGLTYKFYKNVYRIKNPDGQNVLQYVGEKYFNIGAYNFYNLHNKSKSRDGGKRSVKRRRRVKRRRNSKRRHTRF